MPQILLAIFLVTVSGLSSARSAEYCALIEAVLDDETAFLEDDGCAQKAADGPILVEAWLSKGDRRIRPLLAPGTECNKKYLVVEGARLARSRNKIVNVIVVEFERKGKARYNYDASEENHTPQGGTGSSGCGALASGNITRKGRRWIRHCDGCSPR
jgi:hypothetical protein